VSFSLRQTQEARNTLSELRAEAEQAQRTRLAQGKTKASKQEGLYKQVTKALKLLSTNPRHFQLKWLSGGIVVALVDDAGELSDGLSAGQSCEVQLLKVNLCDLSALPYGAP
jgi:hypothetical protein